WPGNTVVELPDLAGSWARAPSPVATPDSSATAVSGALRGASELSLSRLVCPRRLEPETAYIACVVPTFGLGRKAGVGATISANEVTATNALSLAWTITRAPPAPPKGPAEVDLPIYHLRRFRTG